MADAFENGADRQRTGSSIASGTAAPASRRNRGGIRYCLFEILQRALLAGVLKAPFALRSSQQDIHVLRPIPRDEPTDGRHRSAVPPTQRVEPRCPYLRVLERAASFFLGRRISAGRGHRAAWARSPQTRVRKRAPNVLRNRHRSAVTPTAGHLRHRWFATKAAAPTEPLVALDARILLSAHSQVATPIPRERRAEPRQ
jgi:hypothetical protein